MGRNIPNESNRYVCELADELARSEFEEWWEILRQAVPLFSKFAMLMFNDPRNGALLGSLQVILNRAMQEDGALRKSRTNVTFYDSEEGVRQGLIAQLQDVMSICGLYGRSQNLFRSFG